MSADELWQEIDAEVGECAAATALGENGHVYITDGAETQVTREHIDVLLAAFAEAQLPLEAACYIADALIFCDDFDWNDEAVADTIFFLSEESRPLTIADMVAERERLSTAE